MLSICCQLIMYWLYDTLIISCWTNCIILFISRESSSNQCFLYILGFFSIAIIYQMHNNLCCIYNIYVYIYIDTYIYWYICMQIIDPDVRDVPVIWSTLNFTCKVISKLNCQFVGIHICLTICFFKCTHAILDLKTNKWFICFKLTLTGFSKCILYFISHFVCTFPKNTSFLTLSFFVWDCHGICHG